jgi:hypothetical protein
MMPIEGGRRIPLSLMRRGEIFGEMAFFEGRPRSATVVAREPCVLLEVTGQGFRRILEEHPDVEVKVLLKVSERLRTANEQILHAQLHGVDEKLRFFNEKLDVEHRIVDASLKAAQTVFDQTKLRADEVIQSADRSRTRLQVTASVVGLVLTLVVTLLGFLGYRELESVRSAGTEAKGHVKEALGHVEAAKGHVEAVQKDVSIVRSMTEEVKRQRGEVDATLGRLTASMELLDSLLTRRFREVLGDKNVGEAVGIYQEMQALRPTDIRLIEDLYSDLETEILRPKSGKRGDWSDLLKAMLADARKSTPPRNEMWLQALALANALLAKPRDQVEAALSEFERVAAAERARGVAPDKETLRRLKRFFDQDQTDEDKRRVFSRAVLLASGP